MGECILLKSGGGNGSSDVTATKNQLLAGYTAITNDSDDDPIQGTIPVNSPASNQALNCGGAHTVKQGYHPQAYTITANSLASQTSGTATAGQILSGRTAWVNGSKITGTIPSQAGGTLTPSTSAVTANCSGKYMTSNYTIPAFALPPANAIRKGYSYTLYGKTVTGTLEQWLSSPADVTGNETGVTKIGSSTGFFSFITSTSPKGINVFCGSSGGSTLGRLNTAVNVSPYKYLKLLVDRAYDKSGSSYYTKIGISLNADGSGIQYGQEVLANSTVTNYAVIMDVTNYSGMYFIYISVRSASTTKENGIMGGFISLSNS